MDIKTCSECQINKKINDFKTPKGKICKECQRIKKNKRAKQYRIKNKDKIKIKEDIRNKCPKRKEQKRISNKKLYEKNKSKIIKKVIEYEKHRKKTDTIFKLVKNLKKRTRESLLTKIYKKEKLINCDRNFLQKWLIYNLNIDNLKYEDYGYNGWHLDHCIPLNYYVNKNYINQKSNFNDINNIKCCHWTNIIPLESQKNIKKSDNLTIQDLIKQELRVKIFLKNEKKITTFNQNVGVFATTSFKKLIEGTRVMTGSNGNNAKNWVIRSVTS